MGLINKFKSEKKFRLATGGAIIFLILGLVGRATLLLMQPQPTTSQANIIKTVKIENTSSTASPVPSESQTIENVIKEKYKNKKGAGGKDKLREVKVNKEFDDNGGYTVLVYINASENLSTQMIKEGIWIDMADIYKLLYKDTNTVHNVFIFAHYDLEDKYGNLSDTMVLKTSLNKTEADKVNWDADESNLSLSILPDVWTTEKSLLD